ncbi:hypothetical protein [Viscerimonas tarda]
MKKILFISALLILSGGLNRLSGQQEPAPLKVAELCKMVELDNEQLAVLITMNDTYSAEMDSAINKVADRLEASRLIYETKKKFNTGFMDLLSEKQKASYTRVSAHSEIMEKAAEKVRALRKTGKYAEQELAQYTTEIFEYLMLEKIAYTCDKYNIERQKENIAQLKKFEPKPLKAANTLQKAKHQGVVYQGGYKW